MKKTLFSPLILGITIALAALLSDCNSSTFMDADFQMKIRSDQEGRISLSYRTFTGFESEILQAEKGQIISLDYEATVNNGSLIIEWHNSDGEIIWRKILTESDRDIVEIFIESPGRYTILIQGREADGEFDVSWKISGG